MPTPSHLLIGLVPASYLLASVPFGLIVGLAKGVDPRSYGSGNIGATNVGRALGGKYFALVFSLDMLKGFIPMLLASMLVARMKPLGTVDFVLWVLVGAACVLGHVFSCFLRFKGGKGVATSAGVLLGLYPYFTIPGLATLAVWGIAFAIWRLVSIASIAAAAAFPLLQIAAVLVFWPHEFLRQSVLSVAALGIGGLIVWRHRDNIARLRKGTEHQLTAKPS